MKKIKLILFSALLLTTSLLWAQQANQRDSSKNVVISEAEVIAQRIQLFSNLSRVVTVISKAEIAAAPVQTIQDLLRYVAGVDIRQRGANGVQADISVRGGSADQVLILLNGVNITDPQTGHYNLDLPVDLSSVDRIEILQGPGSRVLGPNAFSGAINIITGSAERNNVQVQLVGGQYGLLSREASGTLHVQKLTAFGAVSNNRSEGYTDNTDYSITNAFGQTSYKSTLLGDLSFQAGYQEKAYGANSFYSFTYPNQYEHTRTYFASLTSKKKVGLFQLEPKLYWREHQDQFKLFRDRTTAPSWYVSDNYHATDVLGGGLAASVLTKLGKTSAGVDYRFEHILSNVLGDALDTPKQVFFTSDSAYFTKEKGRQNLNAYLEQSVYLNQFSVSVGVLGNYSNDFGSHFYLGSDLGYAFNDQLKAYASLNQSIRLPTFTDLYYKSVTFIANPDLKPEESTTLELGLKFRKDRLNADLSAFFRQGRNVIDYVKYPNETAYRAVNHAEVNGLGGEFFVEYLPQKYVRRLKFSYAYLQENKSSGDFISAYALDYLKNKVLVNVEHTIFKGLSADWRFSWQDRAGAYTDPVTKLKTSYKPFFLTDVRFNWVTSKGVTLFAEATNLLDATYFDHGGLIQPKRWVKTGINVRF